jgi:hypothetical protein
VVRVPSLDDGFAANWVSADGVTMVSLTWSVTPGGGNLMSMAHPTHMMWNIPSSHIAWVDQRNTEVVVSPPTSLSLTGV